MIIYLYGKDSYRRNKKLQELVAAYKKKHKMLDFLAVDLEDNPDDWLKVRDFLNQPSMFVESKLALVKQSNAVKKKEWLMVLKKYLKTDKIFILISDDNDKPEKDFSFLIKAPVKSTEFPELSGDKLIAFVKKEMILKKLFFSKEAWRFFINYLENAENSRSWLVVNELEKISLAHLSQPISLNDLLNYINWLPKEEVFKITRLILNQKDWHRRLGLLESLFLQGEDGYRIFNSLAYQAEGKKSIFLADCDASIKSGGLEYEEALLDFCLS